MFTARARHTIWKKRESKAGGDVASGAADKQTGRAESGAKEIASLFDDYLEAVHRYVCRRIDNPSDAEEVTAEVFAAAAAELPEFRGEGGYYAWLTGIARRKMVDLDRRRKRQPELLEADMTDEERDALGLLLANDIGDLPEEAVQHEEARLIMRKLIEQLPPAQREALLLQVADELPIKQIAAIMDRTLGATNSLLERARASLYRLGRDYFEG